MRRTQLVCRERSEVREDVTRGSLHVTLSDAAGGVEGRGE
jgi:hypothetical protein